MACEMTRGDPLVPAPESGALAVTAVRYPFREPQRSADVVEKKYPLSKSPRLVVESRALKEDQSAELRHPAWLPLAARQAMTFERTVMGEVAETGA